jgi:hypothetical protein
MRTRFEVLTAANISMLEFWVVTPCGLVGRYQCFGETAVSIIMAEVRMEAVCSSGTY